jgi:hypothetical protein
MTESAPPAPPAPPPAGAAGVEAPPDTGREGQEGQPAPSSRPPGATGEADDLALLRTYEPVVRYTKGECFFPCAVDGYVAGAGLWSRDAGGRMREVVPPGQLTPESLAEYEDAPAGTSLSLRFVQAPLSPLQLQARRGQAARRAVRAPGRLARVPLPARIGDALFDLSLLVRGRVPGGVAAAADAQYQDLLQRDPRLLYYGRVLRRGGWTVLHYLYFYTMNNWRSGFFGVNDHEADWEQAFVYLAPDGAGGAGGLAPRWVAYASHDFRGDDLRRRWDDPILRKEGTHPVIFAGAGSHASYFEPGEYLMGFEPRFLRPVTVIQRRLRELWVQRLGQGRSPDQAPAPGDVSTEAPGGPGDAALVSIPFVDYARGDGVAVGPGQEQEWEVRLISDADPWVDGYRGLWGLDTRDPLGGERAPAGPKYNRDGSVRQAWSDPVGWAGLEKVTPFGERPAALEARLRALDAELADLNEKIDRQRAATRALGLDTEALQANGYLGSLHRVRAAELAAAEGQLLALQAQRVQAAEVRRADAAYLARLRRGEPGDPRAHIRHAHHPEPPLPPSHLLVELWGAVSGALLLLLFVGAIVVASPSQWPLIVVALIAGFGAVEAATRGRLGDFLLGTVVVLAVVTGAVLVWEFWRLLLLALLVVVVVVMVRDNMREIFWR